ncbi:MAG: hypothetical protein AAFU70_06005 [Planctomycetota bacterium]
MKAWLLSVGLGASLVVAGCGQVPGGPQRSIDMFTFESTTFEPKTVRVVDLRDGSEVWSSDVPVGEKLVLRFFDARSDNDYMPDQMHWSIVPVTVSSTTLKSEIPVPPSWARRLEWEIRAIPEAAPDFAPAAISP